MTMEEFIGWLALDRIDTKRNDEQMLREKVQAGIEREKRSPRKRRAE
jgi:hypothetical protein